MAHIQTLQRIISGALFGMTGKAPELDSARRDMIDSACRDYLPSGSGFDSGTNLDWNKSTAEKLVFETAFHHMDSNGFYSGWTHHTVTIRPSLVFGFTVTVSGRNRNEIKDYIAESMQSALSAEYDTAFDSENQSFALKGVAA